MLGLREAHIFRQSKLMNVFCFIFYMGDKGPPQNKVPLFVSCRVWYRLEYDIPTAFDTIYIFFAIVVAPTRISLLFPSLL